MVIILIPLLFAAFTPKDQAAPKNGSYVVIAWNDLGMHCANKTFANMCILPPYNDQYSHVILKGDESHLPTVMSVGSGVHETYAIPGNTYSVGKTDFWTYANQLFGVALPDNIGLTGLGLTGTMHDSLNYFYALGIPLTPYQDTNLTFPDPYQLTLIQAYDAGNNLLGSTQSVIPVSNEINCVSSGCHSSEMDILQSHGTVPGFNINNRPIFCATCHPDNILGMTGNGAPPFSQAIHQAHGGETNDCYKCHPGPNTQCFRDIMHTHGLTCQTCHGSVTNVGNTIEAGRQPWFNEPACGATTCHGAKYAENPGTLYRQSTGHGGLFCEACHNSTHAILTSENARDNIQNIALQGYAGTLSKCEVCHGYIPAGPGPHGYNPMGIKPVSNDIPVASEILPNYPNPCTFMTNIPYTVKESGAVKLEVYDLKGTRITTLIDAQLQPGMYKAELYASRLISGVYICQLNVNGTTDHQKILVIK